MKERGLWCSATTCPVLFVVQSQLRSSQDAVVSAIHWIIISAGFKLTGVGENPSGEKQSTENLLNGWNEAEIYVLHYESAAEPNQLCLLKILPVDNCLLLHFQKKNEENVVILEISVQDFASEDLSSVTVAFRDIDRLNSIIRESLINPAMASNSSTSAQGGANNPRTTLSTGENKQKKKDKKSLLLVEERRPHHQPRPLQPAWYNEEGGIGMDPFSVGRSDLDPLAGMGGIGGGGMIMDPRHSGGPRFAPEAGGGRFGGPSRGGGIHPGAMPPGAVPPGARFDPIGPPGTRPGPDPDHERPPGYDDMFM
ncbi:proteasome inhibitor PI31 subunit-like isoform X2 [Babylonia areolata]|uniref:proteasome inhibitor PI31 subunit-like isoform X2 n=1 Tax=Babylonia areolata TaxID=304850 RepID=UPI003FD2AA85